MARPLGPQRTTPVSDGPRPGGYYRWRDPARVTPARRAELEAHDRRYADRDMPATHNPGEAMKAASAIKQAAYALLRDQGMTIAEAADALGVSRKTARAYESQRKAAAA